MLERKEEDKLCGRLQGREVLGEETGGHIGADGGETAEELQRARRRKLQERRKIKIKNVIKLEKKANR